MHLVSIWEGIFNSFQEAGGDLDAFDSEIWITKQQENIKKLLNQHNEKGLTSKDYPLSLIVAMKLNYKRPLKILDFGGGFGAQYLEILGKVPEAEEFLSYYIIENSALIEAKPEELSQYKNLKFFSNLSEIQETVDIVHIGSTLQYIEDWSDFLTKLNVIYKPQYFVFSDLMAGNVPTFVSHQIFYDKKIPHLFINIDSFINFIIKKMNMNLIFQSKFTRTYFNKTEDFLNNLPEKYRIDRPYNLVFKKSEIIS